MGPVIYKWMLPKSGGPFLLNRRPEIERRKDCAAELRAV